MAVPVLIIGKSGSGKSTSMRNCIGLPDWNLIKVINKPLPFRGHITGLTTSDYQTIMKALVQSKAANIVLDDAGYLITSQFMNGHSVGGRGNEVFDLYNRIGDSFWNLVLFIIEKVDANKIVYIIMHEEQTADGTVKAKTIGKLLDDKVCVEGMFTIVLRCVEDTGRHMFVTQSADGAISKSPMGMFDELTIDNDLLVVEDGIRKYYEMPSKREVRKNEQAE